MYKVNNISQHFEICDHGKHYTTHLVSDEIQVTVLARHTSKGTLLLMELQENQAHTVRKLNPHGYMNSCKNFTALTILTKPTVTIMIPLSPHKQSSPCNLDRTQASFGTQ